MLKTLELTRSDVDFLRSVRIAPFEPFRPEWKLTREDWRMLRVNGIDPEGPEPKKAD